MKLIIEAIAVAVSLVADLVTIVDFIVNNTENDITNCEKVGKPFVNIVI